MYTQRFHQKHTHKYFVDSVTKDLICLCGRVRGEKKKPKGTGNKYNAHTTFYNNISYDSAFEASVAADLAWKKEKGFIKDWERQYKIEIRNPKTGELLRRHRVDFYVHNLDSSFTLLEAKGYETDWYKAVRLELEILWLPEHPDTNYEVVKEKTYFWRQKTTK